MSCSVLSSRKSGLLNTFTRSRDRQVRSYDSRDSIPLVLSHISTCQLLIITVSHDNSNNECTPTLIRLDPQYCLSYATKHTSLQYFGRCCSGSGCAVSPCYEFMYFIPPFLPRLLRVLKRATRVARHLPQCDFRPADRYPTRPPRHSPSSRSARFFWVPILT